MAPHQIPDTALLQHVFEAQPIGVLTADLATGEVTALNRAMADWLGVSGHDSALNLFSLAVWHVLVEHAGGLEALMTAGGVAHAEVSASGGPASVSLTQIGATATVPPAWLLQTVDSRPQLRQALEHRRDDRLEAVARTTGHLAHDFNDLLTIIMGYNDWLAFDQGLTQSSRDAVQQIRLATERASALTRQLLTFSRRATSQRQRLDLAELVESMRPLMEQLLGTQSRLVIAHEGDPPLVKGDASQLSQVLVNLVTNAREAMPQGGTLTIRVLQTLGDPEDDGTGGIAPGSLAAEIEVQDTGVGLTAEAEQRLFEPFFTTKPPGQSAGLGLAEARGIVLQHGGSIRAESTRGGGTTFRILLPLADPLFDALRPAPHHASPGTGGRTILLVEDEDALRDLDAQILARAGFEVLAARSGLEAISMAESHGDNIDLLLTDVMLPGMSGPVVASHLQTARPDLKVLYMSGYSHEEAMGDDDPAGPSLFLQKPMTSEALVDAVRRLIG
jgi:two-component system, cell cycle sensor histidine kinase and response regulator CckA